MISTIIFTLLLCALFIKLYDNYEYLIDNTETYILDDKNYKVLPMNNKEKAAELLKFVDDNILVLKDHINTKYTDIELEMLEKNKKEVMKKIKKRLNETYKSSSLKENYPSKPKVDVSYNLNKGESIALCLREYKNTDEFHEKNDIIFVALHELSHSLNCDENAFNCGNSYGHDNAFWYIFKILLSEAIEIGIYKKINYNNNPIDYCSMKITYSPLYDPSLYDNNYFKY